MKEKILKFCIPSAKRCGEDLPEVILPMAIIPREGLGPLRFGMSVPEVQQFLGSPDDDFIDEDGNPCLWYTRIGVYLFFDEERENKLRGIEVDNCCRCTLFGKSVFPRTANQVDDLLAGLPPEEGASEALVRHIERSGGFSMVAKNLALTFYFDDDASLQEIFLGLYFNEADEVVWPELPGSRK